MSLVICCKIHFAGEAPFGVEQNSISQGGCATDFCQVHKKLQEGDWSQGRH